MKLNNYGFINLRMLVSTLILFGLMYGGITLLKAYDVSFVFYILYAVILFVISVTVNSILIIRKAQKEKEKQ